MSGGHSDWACCGVFGHEDSAFFCCEGCSALPGELADVFFSLFCSTNPSVRLLIEFLCCFEWPNRRKSDFQDGRLQWSVRPDRPNTAARNAGEEDLQG
ncbi:unnamed protein product [Gongylonema pulchrum]|uniref:Secreted protein n=1 Tax=Gongylonema pulchrum TaxID=637853 RepID=A0A183EWA4_9BILA|nr:unnamed protein product [Gongylonema pulchrum]